MYTKEKTIAGKLVAIAGATGDVGEGLARAFLRAGATVLVLTRSECCGSSSTGSHRQAGRRDRRYEFPGRRARTRRADRGGARAD